MPANDPRSDEELIAAANAGDAAAFEALYARHRDWVLRVSYRYVQDRDEALDVLQDVFLYFLGKFPGFQLSCRLTTFLYPVVRSVAITRRRKRRRGPNPLGSTEAGAGTVHGRDAADALAADDLVGVLAGLGEAQREILLMRYVDDLTPTEIAAVLEIPVGTAKSRLHGAVARLRADPRARAYFTD